MTRNIRTFIAIALPIVALALMSGTAMAQSYTGNWPVTWNVTYPGPPWVGEHTYCLTLTDDGSQGFPHSGLATLNGSGQSNVQGIFQVINKELAATFYLPGGYQIDPLVFVGAAGKDKIGKGFGNSPNGAATVTGPLTFGAKGGC